PLRNTTSWSILGAARAAAGAAAANAAATANAAEVLARTDLHPEPVRAYGALRPRLQPVGAGLREAQPHVAPLVAAVAAAVGAVVRAVALVRAGAVATVGVVAGRPHPALEQRLPLPLDAHVHVDRHVVGRGRRRRDCARDREDREAREPGLHVIGLPFREGF